MEEKKKKTAVKMNSATQNIIKYKNNITTLYVGNNDS